MDLDQKAACNFGPARTIDQTTAPGPRVPGWSNFVTPAFNFDFLLPIFSVKFLTFNIFYLTFEIQVINFFSIFQLFILQENKK